MLMLSVHAEAAQDHCTDHCMFCDCANDGSRYLPCSHASKGATQPAKNGFLHAGARVIQPFWTTSCSNEPYCPYWLRPSASTWVSATSKTGDNALHAMDVDIDDDMDHKTSGNMA